MTLIQSLLVCGFIPAAISSVKSLTQTLAIAANFLVVNGSPSRSLKRASS
ncbi:hypothetical protein FV185_18870 [Ferrovum sp. PN-J185]|nr:hypothetical protein FV185_18870 [Ferrovum sp. PN-J185]